MTLGGDFVPLEGNALETTPEYPVVFGIKLTPPIQGLALAALGLGIAAYIVTNFVSPASEEVRSLQTQIDEKEQQLLNREEAEQRIAQARQELQEAQELQADVLTLFANEQSLDTLLLDVNERVQNVNAGIADPERRATLSRFEATSEEPIIVNDSSLGAAANGVLQKMTYNVAMEGNFSQTQSIIRGIERLQPLLLVQNFNSEADQETQVLRLDQQGRTVNDQVVPRLNTTFELIALMPAPQQTPAPAPAAGTAATPAPTPAP